ncbi:hypothetical protein DIPPA_29629 [Diplonema papillatum]|nr:hypothetical protein DIPPA_29629 [Diplonema papillatum]KAJ9460073.1 hypothetical protein DIPPA_29629 [Diplonema papillatum]
MPIKTSGAWKSESGVVTWLAGVKAGVYPVVGSTVERSPGKVAKGEAMPFGPNPTVGEWAKRRSVPERHVWNRVKKCAACGKPNAYTLVTCNSCGGELPDEEAKTPNLFMGIVYGLDAIGLSLRSQTEDVLVIDDLLALSPCHLNAIAASHFVPDLRNLFSNPKKGLNLVKQMHSACTGVFTSQFAGALASLVKDPPADPSALVAAGFNSPPSQYQIHLQYILLPLIPFQAAQLLAGVHFTKGRFFPYAFVVAALAACADKGVSFDPETAKLEEITARLAEMGVVYEVYWQAAYDQYLALQEKHGAWLPENFAGEETDPKAPSVEADKLALQSYGRPYADAKPAANNHYKYAKAPGSVPDF